MGGEPLLNPELENGGYMEYARSFKQLFINDKWHTLLKIIVI